MGLRRFSAQPFPVHKSPGVLPAGNTSYFLMFRMSITHLRTLRSANATKRIMFSWGSLRCMSVGRQVETLLPDIDVSRLAIIRV